MKMITKTFAATLAVGIAPELFAHAGHGASAPSSIAHLLLEPFHVFTAFAPLALIAATVWLMRRRRAARD